MAVPFKIETGQFGLSLTDPGNPVADATIADYTDFSCVCTAGALISTGNLDSESVPGTFCSPGTTTNSPTATTYTLDLSVLQDPEETVLTGLADFLYTNDSGESGAPAYFYLGLAEDRAPKAIGSCWLTPMDFGGEARIVLTADLSLVVEGRPEIEYGVTADV